MSATPLPLTTFPRLSPGSVSSQRLTNPAGGGVTFASLDASNYVATSLGRFDSITGNVGILKTFTPDTTGANQYALVYDTPGTATLTAARPLCQYKVVAYTLFIQYKVSFTLGSTGTAPSGTLTLQNILPGLTRAPLAKAGDDSVFFYRLALHTGLPATSNNTIRIYAKSDQPGNIYIENSAPVVNTTYDLYIWGELQLQPSATLGVS